MIKIGIVGATGYTGVELLRLLVRHPEVQLHAVSSRTEKGQLVANLFPSLRGFLDNEFVDPDHAALKECSLVFFATPNGIAMHQVESYLNAGIRVIDLSADFRLQDAGIWSQWYGQTHSATHILKQAVYGLPEIYREKIQTADLVANPGCYPTAVILSLIPLLEVGSINLNSIIADAKSGISGAGRKASINSLFAETGESFKAYGVSGHRHLPEICQALSAIVHQSVSITFVPHLVPMVRGIHATVYAHLEKDINLQMLYEKRFKDEPFIKILPQGTHPETRAVRGSNFCHISVFNPQQGNTAVILAVIDNLVKGAAGQAIQNMNLMLGFNETSGLEQPGLLP